MKKTANKIFIFLLISIFTVVFLFIIQSWKSVYASEYPFTIENTNYGIEDENVIGKKITIIGDNTEIYNSSTYDKNLYKGYVYVKQTLDDTSAMYYLITSQGCVANFKASVEYDPQDKLIAWPDNGEYINQKLVYEYPYSLYLIYRPDTEKYDILNATTGQYYAHQIDIAWSDSTYFPIIRVENDGKYGVMNIQGEMIHEPIYDNFRFFHNYIEGYVSGKGVRILSANGEESEEFFCSFGKNFGNMLQVCDAETHQEGLFSLETMSLVEPCIHDSMVGAEDGVYTFQDMIDDKDTGTESKICVVTQDGKWDINEQFGGTYATGGSIQDGKISIAIKGGVDEYGYREVIFDGYVSVEGTYVSDHNSIVEEDGITTTEKGMTYGYYNGLLLKERSLVAYDDEFNGRLVTSQGEIMVDRISLEDVSELGDDLILARNADGEMVYDAVNDKVLLEGIRLIRSRYPTGPELFIIANDDSSKFGIYNLNTQEMTGYIFENNFDWAKEIKEYNYDDKTIWYCGENDSIPVLINESYEIIDLEASSFSTYEIDENLNIILDYQQEVAQYQYQRYKKIIDNSGKCIVEFPYYYDSVGTMSPYVVRPNRYADKYGMVSSYNEPILEDKYKYIGKTWHNLCYVEIDDGNKGVVDTKGQFLLQGEFKIYYGDKSIALQDAAITLNDADNSSICYIYSFKKFVEKLDDFEQLKIVDTYPSNGSEGIGLNNSNDIRITFNKNVSLFNDRPSDSLGSIQIKEYDTNDTVLEYNMLSGSKVGQVVYLDSTTAKNSILLKNAMTVLDRGKRYYVVMDSYCVAEEGDPHNPIWFEGISGKNDFSFQVGNNTQVLSDVTYLAACALVQNNLDGCEGMTVEEYVNSKYFQNESIWKGSTITYRRLFLDTLGGYTISDILQPTVHNAGIITFVSESDNLVIFAFKSVEGTTASEQYFTGGYTDYAALKKNYADKSIVLTGENGAGALAAYICGLDNHITRTFNAPIVAGLDLAFANNINLITQYHGIENIPCKNYSCNLFSGINNGEYWNVRLANNPNGNHGSLNQMLEYNDNFLFTSIKSEHKANGMKVRSIMTAEDALKTIQSFLDSLKSMDPFGLVVGLTSEGTEMVLGSSEGDYWRPTRLSPELIYTGGANSSDPDEFYGSGNGNLFNFSGGTAVLYGSSGQDLYFINATSGNVTINDYTDVSYKLAEINNVYSFMNFAKFQLDDFRGPELQDFIKTGMIISGVNNGTDVVYVNTSEVNENQITESDEYYQFLAADCMVQIQKRNTPITVIGLNDTSVILIPNKFRSENSNSLLTNSTIVEKDYSVRGLILNGEDITYDVYVDDVVVESGRVDRENVVGSYHYSVVQEGSDEFCLNVSDDVDKVVITGGTLKNARVGSCSDITAMYVFDVFDNMKKIEINYNMNSVLYIEEGTEVKCSLQNKDSESKSTFLGLSIVPPVQTVYEVGEELDVNGLKVYACYSDGSCTEITDYEIHGFDNTVEGRQDIEIIQGENSNTFSVQVYESGTLIKDINIPESISIGVGSEKLLEMTYTPTTIYDSELIITSSDESIVGVRGSYLVGKTMGTAEITVSDKYGRVKKRCRVIVSNVVLGDVNADGTINLFDLVMCLNHITQKTILYDDAWIAADVNEDGTVNLFDLMYLLNNISQKE